MYVQNLNISPTSSVFVGISFIIAALFTCARLVFVECFDCLPPRLGVAPCIAREHAQMYPHKATPHHATSWNKSRQKHTFLFQSFALEIVEQRHALLAPHVVWRLCVAYLPHPSSGNTWLKVKHVDFICTPSAICMVFSSIQMNSWPISTILGGPYTFEYDMYLFYRGLGKGNSPC